MAQSGITLTQHALGLSLSIAIRSKWKTTVANLTIHISPEKKILTYAIKIYSLKYKSWVDGQAWLFSVVHSLPRRIEDVDSRPPVRNGSASHSSSWTTELTVELETSERIHDPLVFTCPWSQHPSDECTPQTHLRSRRLWWTWRPNNWPKYGEWETVESSALEGTLIPTTLPDPRQGSGIIAQERQQLGTQLHR